MPTASLSSLAILKKLEIQENKITNIEEGDFKGLTNLESLVLNHNHLREIPARTFYHTPQLNTLELDGNHITFIDPDAFIGLESEYLKDMVQWYMAF